ncbi:hypothetical protein BKA66DRAFT_554646 [Pyrenochaeta sp. MPI-SDFR-AT-0127]|nr:hypothetical protein BKA66DRAFT_554646 [Pyrenochaeta sp. MPI-SDFR-AT-0127]
MNTLPAEILGHIVDIIPEVQGWNVKRAQYSSISRAWKTSVERHTFKRFTIKTDELDAFAALFSGEAISRRSKMTSLSVSFMLPTPPNATGCCPVEQPPDREADSIAFSASVVKLFTIMADIEARATEKQPLFLCFSEAYRLSKFGGLTLSTWPKCDILDGFQNRHSRREVMEAQAVSGQFDLVRENIIPTLPGITAFQYLGFEHLSALKPTWIPGIVARLPDLEKLDIRSEDLYSYGRSTRNARRECFAATIHSLAGNHLREIRLFSEVDRMGNEDLPVHRLVKNGGWRQESWFCILNYLASLPNLAILQLHGGLVICPEFFRGIIDHPGTPFPSLVEFELQFSVETADGRWFYERDDDAIESSRSNPEYKQFWLEESMWEEEYAHERDAQSLDSDDYVRVYEDGPFRTDVVQLNRFRSVPNTTSFLPFLMDSSKAALRILNLKKFILKLGGSFAQHNDLDFFPIVSRVFELWYLKAGMHRTAPDKSYIMNPQVPWDAAYLNQNRLYWRVDGTKPWDEVQAAWGAIAGPDAKIIFLEEDQWTGLSGCPLIQVYKGEF